LVAIFPGRVTLRRSPMACEGGGNTFLFSTHYDMSSDLAGETMTCDLIPKSRTITCDLRPKSRIMTCHLMRQSRCFS
jgi:hypothetical protein